MRVILGVTGCIAAYKSALVLRLLQKAGAEVLPVMSRHAQQFIGPLTLEKLSGHRVAGDLSQESSPDQIEHIALARQSDVLAVVPATANILGKFAHGIADDFLSTLYLSTTTPVVVAPAMNVEMWRHPALQANLATLRQRGVAVVEPDSGFLACGEVGQGRLAEPEVIVQAILAQLPAEPALGGQTVLVTAGPTLEDIDPVRFLSNRSSGKMGYAMAAEARRRGARVILVSGPTVLDPPQGVELLPVRSAQEMEAAVVEQLKDSTIVVMAAAMSDFRPAAKAAQKIKKDQAQPHLDLQPNPDILLRLGRRKNGRFLVGFAAESERLEENARLKLARKNLDLIVANDISSRSSGFESDHNQVVLITPDGPPRPLPRMPKAEVACKIWDAVEQALVSQPAAAGGQHDP